MREEIFGSCILFYFHSFIFFALWGLARFGDDRYEESLYHEGVVLFLQFGS
jgi:hypothetical protein